MADSAGAGGDQPAGANATHVPIFGGYELTPAQVDNTIANTQDVLNSYANAESDLRVLGTIQAIAPSDDTSNFQAHQISLRVSQLLKWNDGQKELLSNWLQLLQKAKANYMNQEHLTAAQWKRLAEGPGA